MTQDSHPAFVGHSPEMVECVFKRASAYEVELQDLLDRTILLSKDFGQCTKPLKKNPNNQFWRRTAIKNLFVIFEATTFGLKRIALHQHEHREVGFSAAEVAILNEEKYVLENDGKAHALEKNFQRFFPNLKFAFKCFAKAYGFPFVLDVSKDALVKTFEEVRNRITHPKRLSELTVQDHEFQAAIDLWNWFSEQLAKLVAGVNSASRNPHPIRNPVTKPISNKINVSKPYLVVRKDGNYYQFDTLKEAKAYRRSHTVRNSPSNTALLFRTEDFFKD
jgi:hypothetical protein